MSDPPSASPEDCGHDNGDRTMTEKGNNDDDRLTAEEAYQLQKSDVPTNPFEALTTLAGLASKPRDDKEEG